MIMLSMDISHWQYVWPFYSCVYLPDIYLRDIFAGHCHFLTYISGIVFSDILRGYNPLTSIAYILECGMSLGHV